MCLAFVASGVSEEYPLVIAFNRDEEFSRRTRPLHWWDDIPTVLGGRDLLNGGTWAGVTKTGDFAFLTFVREKRSPVTPTGFRGKVVSEFLQNPTNALSYLQDAKATKDKYLGYNLVLGRPGNIYHYNNRENLISWVYRGVSGVSNATINSSWMKVECGKKTLESIILENHRKGERELVDSIFSMLGNKERSTKIDRTLDGSHLEPKYLARSSMFVRDGEYGTVSSSVILYHRSGRVLFSERAYEPSEEIASANEIQFHIS